jgi:hypothetical protein
LKVVELNIRRLTSKSTVKVEMMAERKPPIIIQPTSSQLDQSKAAAFVFVHGLGDEADGVESECFSA